MASLLLAQLRVLTVALALDDLFVLHEGPLHTPTSACRSRRRFSSTPRGRVIGGRYRQEFRTMPWILIVLAFTSGAFSVAFDQSYPGSEMGWEVLLEDGAKLFAITSWTLFFVLSCRRYPEPARGGEAQLRSQRRP